jgi:hypothetical protein
VERAGEGQRKRTRATAGLKATRGSCQSRRWHQQSCNGDERRRPVAAEGQLKRAAEQRGVLGESLQEGVEAVGELGGDAWRPGEAGGPRAARHGDQRRRCCAAEGEQRKKKGGGGARG